MGQTESQTKWKAPFFTIWIGQQVSLIGSNIAQFAVIWWITETTGSATILTFGLLIAIIPGVILGPFIGALIDRWNRRIILITADSVIALMSVILALLFWRETIEIWHVYVIVFIRGIGDTFHFPAMAATTPLMVPKKQLARVAGLNQTTRGAVNIIAPLAGALLLELFDIYEIMIFDVATAAFAIFPLLIIAIPQPQRSRNDTDNPEGKQGVLSDMHDGFKYVWNWSGLRALIVLTLILNFLVNPPVVLMPILVTEHFGGDVLQLGWMNSVWGVGYVIGGVLLSIWGGFQRRIVTMLIGVIGLGIGILVVGLTPVMFFPLALGGFFFGAVMNAMSNGSMFAVLQDVIAPEVQGRVFSFGRSLANAAMPLGLAIVGPLAEILGIHMMYVISGVIYILIGVGAFFVKPLLYIENENQSKTTSLLVEEDGKYIPELGIDKTDTSAPVEL